MKKYNFFAAIVTVGLLTLATCWANRGVASDVKLVNPDAIQLGLYSGTGYNNGLSINTGSENFYLNPYGLNQSKGTVTGFGGNDTGSFGEDSDAVSNHYDLEYFRALKDALEGVRDNAKRLGKKVALHLDRWNNNPSNAKNVLIFTISNSNADSN